ESCHDDGHRQARWVEENVEEQDVHNDRAEQRKSERNVASGQEEQTAADLQHANDVDVMALHERFAKVSGKRRRRRRHRNEVYKDVRAEDNEQKSKQEAGEDGEGFHPAIMAGSGAFSNYFPSARLGELEFAISPWHAVSRNFFQ